MAVTARSGEGPEGTLTVRADVTDAEALDAAFTEVEEKLGPVEVVVANAGSPATRCCMRMSDEDFDEVVDTNLGGAFRVVKRASKGMLKARFGRIILVSSVVGLYGSRRPGQLLGIQERPGRPRPLDHARTGRARHHRERRRARIHRDRHDGGAAGAATQQIQENIPAGRFATPDEVAKVIAWLASDDAAYISGAVIPVDGGLGMGH